MKEDRKRNKNKNEKNKSRVISHDMDKHIIYCQNLDNESKVGECVFLYLANTLFSKPPVAD